MVAAIRHFFHKARWLHNGRHREVTGLARLKCVYIQRMSLYRVYPKQYIHIGLIMGFIWVINVIRYQT